MRNFSEYALLEDSCNASPAKDALVGEKNRLSESVADRRLGSPMERHGKPKRDYGEIVRGLHCPQAVA
jgi:hypothetical protein